MTEDQIDELRDLQKALRAQAEVVTDTWHDWVNSWEPVSQAIHEYNKLLHDARTLTGDPIGEFGDLDPEFDPQEFKLDEADAIEAIIEDEEPESPSDEPPPALKLAMERDLDGAVRYGKVFGDFLDSMLSPKAK